MSTSSTSSTSAEATDEPVPAGQPLAITLAPRLDAALDRGWADWEEAARAAGVGVVAGWLAQRLGDAGLKRGLIVPVRDLLEAAPGDERTVARAELAELVEGEDAAVADTLWEGVLADALEAEDPDAIAEATAHLAAIAEAHGDPLAAAEYHLAFLNWRREPGHTSDPEAVEDSFEEVVRLATADGDPKAAAIYAFRQVGFTGLVEAEDDRATEGDWETDPAPYRSWA
jgi:hypothetical protein